MILHLLRHGKTIRDSEERTRPLAARGERQARWLGALLRERGFAVDRVLHSPRLRSRQTTALVCDQALPDTPRDMVEWMLPGDDVESWVERFATEAEDLLMVGHNDFLECLAEQLLGEWIRFKTCTFASLRRREDGSWELLEHLHPDPATR